MKGGGRRQVDNEIFKLWYTPLIATDLGKYFLSQRLRLLECRWEWECLVAFRTRESGVPLCSRLTPCFIICIFTISTVAAKQGTFKAEAGRVCVLGVGENKVTLWKTGAPT